MKHRVTTPALLLLLVAALAQMLCAQTPAVVRLHHIDTPIVVDGIVDPAWALADSATGFTQHFPYNGKPSSRTTVARLLTTDHSIYCLMVCRATPGEVQAWAGRLDDANGDVVSVMFDTFNDRRTAYKFAVTASGVRADCRLLDDGRNRDYNWDGVWFAATSITDQGFVVEMEIPYKSIQYDETIGTWGLDFDRWISTGNEDTYWRPYDENTGQRISQFGTLDFGAFHPSIKGLNLEIYPVGLAKADYIDGTKYRISPDAGIDIFYNPSQSFTFQLTGNPDFAQIEADPFAFNISRYETYFNERRPFFTQGNEIFMPSGRDRNMGFYQPLELFYSRRIGAKLPDGSEVPLLAGTKAFGRVGEYEYGGFLAMTGGKDYIMDGSTHTEPAAVFASGRVKKQILGNSSVGVLFVGKKTSDRMDGVLDVDGAFRGADWQLSYQLARSINNDSGDYAVSAGFTQITDGWISGVRFRHVGSDFDIRQVGYVPWLGTTTLAALSGPRWYYSTGYLSALMFYGGFSFMQEKVDAYTDWAVMLGLNMNFRDNWGYELNCTVGRSRDLGIEYPSSEVSLSSWVNINPSWWVSTWGGWSNTYNFNRNYTASYAWIGNDVGWHMLRTLDIGASSSVFFEGRPDGGMEDVIFNTRPFISFTPVNDLNLRFYCDNLWMRSAEGVQQFIAGFLFSWNFSPKSWLYFAINELRDRHDRTDATGSLLPAALRITERVAVLKVKYLYYF